MYARIRVGLFGTAAVAVAAKAVLLTISDDWDDVAYSARKVVTFQPPPQRKPRVVVLGSGWGALSFIRKLDQAEVDLTIVSPRPFFFYTPLLAGTATGTVSHGSIVEPVRWYCDRAGHGGAKYIQADCTSIDPHTKRLSCTIPGAIHTPSTLALEYDYLVISVGAEPATFNIPGVREHTRFIKEVEDGIAIQKDILQKLELASALQAAAASAPPDTRAALEAEVRKLLSWVVIGGGPTGVELTAELTDFVASEVAKYFPALAPKVTITLLEAADRVLGVFDPALSKAASDTLVRLGAQVRCNTAVTRVTGDAVEVRPTGTAAARGGASSSSSTTTTTTSPIPPIPYGTAVWAGGIARRPVVEAFAKTLDPAGTLQNSRFGLVVDPWFRVKGVRDGSVYALGDCAVSGCAPTAQAAVQQGRYLGRAFRDSLPALSGEAAAGGGGGGETLPPPFKFRPRGSLAYTGGGTGVAELKSLWDSHPGSAGGSGSKGDATHVEGTPAFAIWRSLYFSSILSISNQARVVFDWTKAYVFGRDITTPFMGSGGGGGSAGGSEGGRGGKTPAL